MSDAVTKPNPDELVRAVTRISARFQEINDDPDQGVRREQREDFAVACIRAGVQISALGKYALWKNIEDGSWKTAVDREGYRFATGVAYFLEFWSTHVEEISRSTAYADFEKFRIMSELLVPEADQRALIATAPAVTGKFLANVVELNAAGAVIGVAEDYRVPMKDQLGIPADETMTDKELTAEFLHRMAEVGSKTDVGAMVQAVMREWRFTLTWMDRENVFVLFGTQPGNADKIRVLLAPLNTGENKAQMAKPRFKQFLRNLMNGRVLRL